MAMTACVSSGGNLPSPLPLAKARRLSGLTKPEGVVTTPDGRLIVSDPDGAVAILSPDGGISRIGKAPAATGLAMDRQGRVIIANFGLLADGNGPLQRLDLGTGAVETLADSLDGRRLVASNAPAIGPGGEVYCSHSTWANPANIGTTDPAGFVYKVAADGRVSRVCDGIRGANGICFDRDFRHLYVAQTAAGTILRYRRGADGSYRDPVQYGPVLGLAPDNLSAGDIYGRMAPAERAALGHPDGVALDAAGNLWVTLPFANRVVAITPTGQVVTILSDPEGQVMQMPTSLAWGGADLCDLSIVSRRNGAVLTLRTPIPGLPLPHWG
ncbi:MAG: SMP-30/gluconolactonase/LRE family protein [Niveispirillum sp.]|nr:SMP-30/gluconolactonase/LRE family protein [Niveispirillum sp.]